MKSQSIKWKLAPNEKGVREFTKLYKRCLLCVLVSRGRQQTLFKLLLVSILQKKILTVTNTLNCSFIIIEILVSLCLLFPYAFITNNESFYCFEKKIKGHNTIVIFFPLLLKIAL